MKPVLIKKREFSFKDILSFFAIGFGHYLLIFIYIGIIFLIRYFVLGKNTLFDNTTWLLFYPAIIAPSVNWSLHIWFAERGRPWVRLIMWLNTLLMLVLVPIGEFI